MERASGPALQQPRDGQAVCLACGLCCRGVWFSNVVLEADEVVPALKAGLPLNEDGEKVAFQQPCVLHKSGCCSAYAAWRPRACVKYSCRLLDRFQAGETSLEEAVNHVTAARAMADRVTDEAGFSRGGLQGNEVLARVIDSNDDAPVGGRSLSPGVRLDAVALRIYYKKYFQQKAE
jgi:hypothetical protein